MRQHMQYIRFCLWFFVDGMRVCEIGACVFPQHGNLYRFAETSIRSRRMSYLTLRSVCVFVRESSCCVGMWMAGAAFHFYCFAAYNPSTSLCNGRMEPNVRTNVKRMLCQRVVFVRRIFRRFLPLMKCMSDELMCLWIMCVCICTKALASQRWAIAREWCVRCGAQRTWILAFEWLWQNLIYLLLMYSALFFHSWKMKVDCFAVLLFNILNV